MIQRAVKLRWRRYFRRSKRQVEGLGTQAESQLETHFFRRLGRLSFVRRFVLGWLALIMLLAGGLIYQMNTLSRHYKTLRYVSGGIYTEGVIGSFTNANPLYASTPVDTAVSRLVFAGLLKYDQTGNLTGDLASKWTVDEKGTTYRVNLKPDLVWHDGQELTSEDVLFTYQTIQKAEARSPLFSSWQGIKIETKGPRTIVFTLPNPLASFPYSLTNGIVPKHVLDTTPAAQLRSIPFGSVNPVGSGPFMWDAIQVEGDTPKTRQELIALRPFERYHDGAPKLSQFKLRTYRDEQAMVESFRRHELTAMSSLSQTPDNLEAVGLSTHEYNVPLMGQVGVFFKTTEGVLKDTKVRQALTLAVNQPDIIKGMNYPVVPLSGPLMKFQLGYSKEFTQLGFNQQKANAILDEAGWLKGANGKRTNKDGTPLKFQLYAQSTSDNAYVTQRLQHMWQDIGAEAEVLLVSEDELQRPVVEHSYDALLYGITIGRDPDVFAYWHSSQASSLSANRLNFSEYKSSAADKALEAGRTRSDPELRAVKYRPFLESWRNDAPAIMLYQPRFLYISNNFVSGLSPKMINAPADRYANVENWMIREVRTSD